MKAITLALVVLFALIVFTQAALSEEKRVPCAKSCFIGALDTTDEKSAKKSFPKCIRTCLKNAAITKDDTASLLKSVNKFRKLLKKVNVQEKEVAEVKPEDNKPEEKSEEAVLSENDDVITVASDAALASGTSLRTTAGLNVRSGPCTNKSIKTTLAAGATVKYTGSQVNQCGYTWYGISGSFGSGYAASKYLTPVSSGSGGSSSGSTCKTRSYPLFKQCDGRWGGNSLGSRTVCAIGCLMSSVSMAMNGLGKTINGKSANPGSLNAYLKSNGGYSGNLFVWGSVSRFGLKYQGKVTSQSAIKAAICANKIVIGNVNNYSHWVLLTGHNGSSYTVNDPGYTRSTYPVGEVKQAAIYTL